MTATMVDYAHTSTANSRREMKARAIAAALLSAGYSFTAVCRLTQPQRRVVEQFAHVTRASDETWTAAQRIVREALP